MYLYRSLREAESPRRVSKDANFPKFVSSSRNNSGRSSLVGEKIEKEIDKNTESSNLKHIHVNINLSSNNHT